MTALQWIVKEAKALKKKYPKRYKTWTEYVKQASAIYASKHKEKSPVGKKKAAVKKRAVKGITTRKAVATKKPISENKVLHEIEKVKKDIQALEKLQKAHITSKHKSSIGAAIRKKHTSIKTLLKKF